ncbi:Unknown protein, partial [Striga hermonthica]
VREEDRSFLAVLDDSFTFRYAVNGVNFDCLYYRTSFRNLSNNINYTNDATPTISH